ncbi:MAG TPA: hypothetical protein VGF46_06115 [Gaiellales bacterium]|jgi:hypothetical protein
MLAGAIFIFGAAILGSVLIECWRRGQSRQYEQAEVRELRSREAWDAIAQIDHRRAA